MFNNEAEQCGSPCSNRLMVTLQGEVYVTEAYSHQLLPTSIARDEALCFNWLNIDNGEPQGASLIVQAGGGLTAAC
jgi:hypothetical protein